jgi:hypothetical protein
VLLTWDNFSPMRLLQIPAKESVRKPILSYKVMDVRVDHAGPDEMPCIHMLIC